MFNKIASAIITDTGEIKTVKTIVHQQTIWPDYYEVRAICSDGAVFSALYLTLGDEQATDFVLVPIQEAK